MSLCVIMIKSGFSVVRSNGVGDLFLVHFGSLRTSNVETPQPTMLAMTVPL